MQEAWERTCAYSAGVVVTKDVFSFAWCLEFTGDAMDDVLQNLWTSFEMDWTA